MNMPHSGGGGSHGGGSHGGSHGGSSHRTSHTYFYGARRYRRHYTDGRPDEYFYSNGRPQKTGAFSLIFVTLFGVIFTTLMGIGMGSTIPKKLNEEYGRLSEYDGNYESGSSKAKRFIMKYLYVLTMLTIDTVCLIIRIARFGFTPPTGALEVVLIFIAISVTFVALILPMIMQRVKERNEEINGINYARET